MNRRMIVRLLGQVMLIYSALMLLPLIAGLCYGESVLNFVIAIAATAAFGGFLLLFKPYTKEIFAKEGFVVVGLSWVFMGLFGAVPFVLCGDIPNYIDAVFETISGLTTTGSSIVTDIEGMTRGALFWRCFTHWIGGMGVLVFFMAVVPMSGDYSMHIMRAEVPGPVVGKLVPRARDTAKILYLMYGALTVLETIFLMAGGMTFYDAILHAFATAGTGGFSTKGASIAAFDSVYIELVIGVFLIFFGTNFSLYYLVLIGHVKEALKSEELHWFLAIIAGSTVMIALTILHIYQSIGTSLRHAFFYTMSILTTAGFGTEDYNYWPVFSQTLLVALMLIGGCAGSTGGGIKVSRFVIWVKSSGAEILKMSEPRTVRRPRMDGKCLDDKLVKAVMSFIALYIFLIIATALLVSLDPVEENDFATAFSATIACISNIGPGLGAVGPKGSFAFFSYPVKILLTFAMLLGRLEIYPILIMLRPAVWKKR